jgi:RHS repeat-associated protein
MNNLLNQLTGRGVPGYVEVLGAALATNSVAVNGQTAERQGEYFRRELAVDNAAAAVWQGVTVSSGGTSESGHRFVARAAEAFGYDADGNLTQDGRWEYTWDAENRLVRLVAGTAVGPQQRLEFEYDAQGRRIGKKVWDNPAGTGTPVQQQRFVYDGWNLIAMLDSQSSILQSFVWGLDLSGSLQGAGGVGGLLWLNDTANGTHFCAYDGNGNVVALTSAADGTESGRYEYGPFGEPIRGEGAVAEANPFRFSTKFTDHETDLLYYGYRFYNASMGRWPSRDPIGDFGSLNVQSSFVTGDEQSEMHIQWLRHISRRKFPEDAHPYHFCWNTPLNRWDYLGLGNEPWRHGKCCNNSGGDEWALVSEGEGADEKNYWKKLSDGECVGGVFTSQDCEGMTCDGGFYVVKPFIGGNCRTPGCDRWPYKHSRWTPNPSDRDPGAGSPDSRAHGVGLPEGYKFGPRKDCCN